MLTIDTAVFNAYPGAKMGILAMRSITPSAPLDPSVISDAMEEIRRRYGHLDRAGLKAMHPTWAYVEYYQKFGYSYHVLAQLESVLKGKRTPGAGSGVLQAMFLSEVESMLLTAGHDLHTLRLPLRLQTAAGDETYVSISGKEVTAVLGDLMVCDGSGVISSILRGPDFGSRITGITADVLFTVYAPPGIDADSVKTAMQKLAGRIRSFSPLSETIHLSVYDK
ncbi:MAG: hypothetical protein ABIG45_09165 [Bacillota bacterium]